MTEMTAAGSMIVTAFEAAWADIRAHHPEVPNVVFVSGGGVVATRQGIAVKWGHFGADHWDTETGKAHELFVSGESLSRDPHLTMTTLLHEAAHALCHERGVKDTTRRGAYHNKRFVAAAVELGLVWPTVKGPDGEPVKDANGKEIPAAPCKTRGFSEVVITDETREQYKATIEALGAARVAWRSLMGFGLGEDPNGGEGGSGGSGDGDGEAPKRKRSRNTKPKAICGCEDAESSAIWIARKTLEAKHPMCGICREEYRLHPDYADEDDES